MEDNFSMEWNMDWKWNGRNLPVWNMEKSSSIPYHALLTEAWGWSTEPLETMACAITVKVSPLRRHGGAFRGRAPPNHCLCSPKRELCPHPIFFSTPQSRYSKAGSGPHREILSRSACTETKYYDCVPPEMSAMMNDHAMMITTTN